MKKTTKAQKISSVIKQANAQMLAEVRRPQDFFDRFQFTLSGHIRFANAERRPKEFTHVMGEIYCVPQIKIQIASAEQLNTDEDVKRAMQAYCSPVSDKGVVVSAAEAEIALANLAMLARNGNGKALWQFANLISQAVEGLNEMARSNPDAIKPFAKIRTRWPMMRSPMTWHRYVCQSSFVNSKQLSLSRKRNYAEKIAPNCAPNLIYQKEIRVSSRNSCFHFQPMNVENPEISLVIPCYNEEGNLRELVKAIRAAVEPLKISYEIVITDDCSKDKSWEILKELAANDPKIRVQKFAFNCGESAASFAGLKAARGKFLFTLDADLQNDPKDLPKFLEALKNFDCVCGTRVKARGDGDNFIRIASSRIANWVRNKLSGEQIADAGCTYRAFKRECIENLKFFKGMHRFLPTLFKIEGHTVKEIEVSNNPRFAGQSNYGVWNRLFASFYDLLVVRWMKKRMFKYKVAERVN